jgi:hypothetical protein
LANKLIDPEHSEAYLFKLSPEGKVERVVKSTGMLKDGQPIKGTGRFEELAVDAPGVREALDRELAFWLDGQGLKPTFGTKSHPAGASRH